MSDVFALTSAYLGGATHLVTVAGDLDVGTAPGLRDELRRITDEGALKVIVDLLQVAFVDSVALGILVEASKRTRARGGTFALVCADRRIARIIEITGLDRVMRVYLTLRGALESPDDRPLSRVSAG